MQVTNDWARQLRENERETVISMFLLAMENVGVPDEQIERVKNQVEMIYEKLERREPRRG